MYDLYEAECSEVSRSTASEPMVHCLTGKGMGCQYFSIEDEDVQGIWLHETIDVESGFLDALLVDYTIDEFLTRLQDYQWQVTTKRELMLSPGDIINFHPKWEAPEELSVMSLEEDESKDLTLELGARQPDYSDAWESSQSIGNGYSAGYMQESHLEIQATTPDFNINDPAHISAPLGELTFAVPDNVLATNLVPKITLDLSINFKTDKLLKVGCCAVELKTGSVYRQYGNFIGWTPGGEIKTIDITTWLTAGTSNVITIGIYAANEYTVAHSAYTEHPVLTASGTMKFWKRKALA